MTRRKSCKKYSFETEYYKKNSGGRVWPLIGGWKCFIKKGARQKRGGEKLKGGGLWISKKLWVNLDEGGCTSPFLSGVSKIEKWRHLLKS